MQVFRFLGASFLLFTVAAFLARATPARAQGAPAQPVISKAASAHFVALPLLPSCATFAVETGDPSAGPSVLLARVAPGCKVPWHWHTPNEHVMMVSGTLELQVKGEKPAFLHAGDYALMPAHHIHRGKAVGSAPSSFFIYSDDPFDIHYVDQAGNEITLETALKATTPAHVTHKAKKR